MRSLYKILAVVISITAFSHLSIAQCIKEGFKTDVVVSSGSGTIYDNNFSSEVIVGQHFISGQLNAYNGSTVTGYWSIMNNAPIVANVDASDGIHQDRITISWSVNENTPAITGGFKIYKDGYLIGSTGSNDYTFIDYNIIPGVYYTYSVSGVNSKGEGIPTEDLGYVNPNGVISGRITTFSGSSVEGAVVTLSPSNNLSLRCLPGADGGGGLYIDTLLSNPNPLVDSVFTLSMWVKTLDYTSEGFLFDYGYNDDENFWMGVESDSTVYVTMADATGNKTVRYKIPGLNTQYNWQHFAAVYNGRDLQLYFNGALVGSQSLDLVNAQYANAKIGIGANSLSTISANQFNGYIDDVRLFSRVQRPSEIKKLMHTTVPSSYDGLVAYWKMDEGKGDRVINQVETDRVGVICRATFADWDEPGIQSAGISNSAGYYVIEDVNYSNGTSFTVMPNKFVSYNTALEFNDIEQNYAVTSALTISDTATIEFWFSPYHYNGVQYLMSSNSGLFNLYLDGNALKLDINGEVNTIANVSGFNYKYLTIIKEAGDVTVYLNANQGALGQLQSFSYSYTSEIPQTTYQLARSNGGANYYSGLIDGLVVWDIALPYAGSVPGGYTNENGIDMHFNNGIHTRMDTLLGLEVVNEHITAFIHLNDQEGNQIVNDVPLNGALTYGTVNNGAQFVDVVAHEYGIDHQFQPNARIVTLNSSNTSADAIDFTDITTVPITGLVKYENTFCFIENAQIYLDGQPTVPPTYTDENGKWVLEIEPGADAQISVAYEGHDMYPSPMFQLYRVNTPVSGILFVDQELRSVSGTLTGGECGLNIIDAGETATIQIQSQDACFTREIVLTDANTDGAFLFDNLPPLEYTVLVTNHTNPIINDWFTDPGQPGSGGFSVDLTDNNDSVEFVYYAPYELELTGLDPNACGDIPLIQGLPQQVTVKVFEDYLGTKCYLDEAELLISDAIGYPIAPSFTPPNATMTNGEFVYTFAPMNVNLAGNHENALTFYAQLSNSYYSSVNQSINGIVQGQKSRATTYTTTSPVLPTTILRDPPGDQSFASWAQSTETCLTDISVNDTGITTSSYLTGHLGPDIETTSGIGFSVGTNLDWTLDITAQYSYSENETVTQTNSMCATVNEMISTSSDLIGSEGDIYVGSALNLEYGLMDILTYDENNCATPVNIYQELRIDPVEFSTFYVYSEYQIINDVIPTLQMLAANPSADPDSAAAWLADAQTWQSFVDTNNAIKANYGIFEENRTFDAGVSYSATKAITETVSKTIAFNHSNDPGFALDAGFTANGLGFTVGNETVWNLSYGTETTNDSTVTTETSFTLADDDIGDNFTVNIYRDTIFGTPIFNLIAGESSCPHEENTLPREGVQVLVDQNTFSLQDNVSADQPAVFQLYISNTSQSSETMTYAVDVVNNSNPYGAELSINGAPLVATSGGSGITYTLDPLVGQTVTLTLDRGPIEYEYDSIQVVFQSLCDEQISDTVLISAHFVEPCSSVDIYDPLNGWVITPADSGQMVIGIDNYDETDPDLNMVRIQYRPVGTPAWISIEDIPAASLGPVYTLFTWEIGALPDGEYELIATTQCLGGLPSGYSEVVDGIIEQQSPEVLGTPQPTDGIYNNGDEISVTFTEQINCNNIFEADQSNLNNIGLYNLTTGGNLVSAVYQCVGDKIIVTPNVPTIYLENQTLQLRFQGIEDLVGNSLDIDPVTGYHVWEFYVNVSPVSWVGAAVDEIIEIGSIHQFSRVIENSGGNPVSYTINCPTYLTPSSSSGLLPAGGQQTITFTVNNQLVNGEYTGNLTLSSSYGDELLPFDIRVICPEPTWSVNPSLYMFNMNYTVALDIQGQPSEDELDIIAGFVNGETRGVAHVQYVSALDKYLAFLSVYGNTSDNGEDVTFKIWDASECKLYESTFETYPFAANGQIGTPNVADTIHTMNLLAEKIYLNAGWNWISFNLEVENDSVSNVMSSLTNPSNGLIKSQTEFSQYYPTADTWVGGLVNIDERSMYQVKVIADDSLEFYGTPIEVDSSEIPLVAGWNWIGYLPQSGMTPNWAFQVLNPYSGDLVKNQYFFAQYVAGSGWIGNLTYMNAPSGYLYSSSVVDTLIYPIDANTPVLRTIELETEQDRIKSEMFNDFELSNISPNQFQSNMNLIGIGENMNHAVITEVGDKVYAYIDGQVRGVSEVTKLDDFDNMFFLTIYGNSNDEGKKVEFKYLDDSSGILYEVEESFEFASNEVIGEVLTNQSLTIGIEAATSVEDIKSITTNAVSVYPNPFKEDAIISIYSENDQEVSVFIYDNLGKLVGSVSKSVSTGTSKISFVQLAGQPSQGVYYVKVRTESDVHNVKVINQ